jgi:hypothetical protein
MLKRRTNFATYLKDQLKDPDFEEKFRKAGEVWEAALRSGVGRKTSSRLSRKGSRRAGKSRKP